MKKLFVWAYTKSNPNVLTLCGLEEDGNMLFAVEKETKGAGMRVVQKDLTELMVSNNTAIRQKYEVINVDQDAVEKVIYEGGDRKALLPEDFRKAWGCRSSLELNILK